MSLEAADKQVYPIMTQQLEMMIDVNATSAIPFDRTINLVNIFILKSTEFLNNFSLHSESQLREIGRRLNQVEALISILESKLDSIPNLGVSSSVPSQPASTPTTSDPSESLPPPPSTDHLPPPPTEDSLSQESIHFCFIFSFIGWASHW